jgi:hypothetical protein
VAAIAALAALRPARRNSATGHEYLLDLHSESRHASARKASRPKADFSVVGRASQWRHPLWRQRQFWMAREVRNSLASVGHHTLEPHLEPQTLHRDQRLGVSAGIRLNVHNEPRHRSLLDAIPTPTFQQHTEVVTPAAYCMSLAALAVLNSLAFSATSSSCRANDSMPSIVHV